LIPIPIETETEIESGYRPYALLFNFNWIFRTVPQAIIIIIT